MSEEYHIPTPTERAIKWEKLHDFRTEQLKKKEQQFQQARARIAALEAVLRENIEATEATYHAVAGDAYHMTCPGSAIKVNTTVAWIVMDCYPCRSNHKVKERIAAIQAAREKAKSILADGRPQEEKRCQKK